MIIYKSLLEYFLEWEHNVGSSLSLRNASNGCISHRLGSGHDWPPCPRSVEWSPSHVAHQLPGDAGRVSSTQTLSTRPERSPCVGASRHPVEVGLRSGEWMLQPEGWSRYGEFGPGSGGSVCDSSDNALSPLVLEFLQARFSAGLAHSTLKVYVAAIAAYHAPLGGLSVGKTL